MLTKEELDMLRDAVLRYALNLEEMYAPNEMHGTATTLRERATRLREIVGKLCAE